MECPTSGLVCEYRTTVNRVHGIAIIESLNKSDQIWTEMSGIALEIIHEGAARPEVSSCLGDRCKVLETPEGIFLERQTMALKVFNASKGRLEE